MNYVLENDIRILSGYSYDNGKFEIPYGWKLIGKSENLGNGFYSEAFYKDGIVVIIYRGTDIDKGANETFKDLGNDGQMLIKNMPEQVANAKKFYNDIAYSKKYRNCKIYAGGHSLGASIVQIVSSTIKGLEGVTFNGYGTGNIKGVIPKYPENVTNYGNSKDIVFTSNLKNQIGKTYIIDEKSSLVPRLQKFHGVQDMGDIRDAREYFQEESVGVLSKSQRLTERLQMEWAEDVQRRRESRARFENEGVKNKKLFGYVNNESNKDWVYTEEEIDGMRRQERSVHSRAIEHQRNRIGIPTRAQAVFTAAKGGLVQVTSHIREGFRVREYFRAFPHRG